MEVLVDQVPNEEETLKIRREVLGVDAVAAVQTFEKRAWYLLFFYPVKRVAERMMISRIQVANLVYVVVHVMVV